MILFIYCISAILAFIACKCVEDSEPFNELAGYTGKDGAFAIITFVPILNTLFALAAIEDLFKNIYRWLKQ